MFAVTDKGLALKRTDETVSVDSPVSCALLMGIVLEVVHWRWGFCWELFTINGDSAGSCSLLMGILLGVVHY